MLDKKKDLGAGDAEASHQDRHAAPRLNNKGADARKSPRDLLTEQRVRLRDAGFAPIPVSGKRPVIAAWQQKTDATDADFKAWREDSPYAENTGLLTRLMPTLDVDIYNPEAAKAVEELVRERFEARGNFWFASATRPSTRFRSAPINPSKRSRRTSPRRRMTPQPYTCSVVIPFGPRIKKLNC
jgi:hypothetical protein